MQNKLSKSIVNSKLYRRIMQKRKSFIYKKKSSVMTGSFSTM